MQATHANLFREFTVETKCVPSKALNPDFDGTRSGWHRSLIGGQAEEHLAREAAAASGGFQVEIVQTPNGWVIRDLDISTGACVAETAIGSSVCRA